MHLVLKFLAAFGVGWLTRMIEDSLTLTAWGGPFTILASWIVIVFLSAFYAVAAMVIGGLFFPRRIKEAWNRAGSRVLLLAIPPALVLAFSSVLGLRTIEPESNYSLMAFWPSVLCHFFIVFPVANLPVERRAVPPAEIGAPPTRSGGEPLEYDY